MDRGVEIVRRRYHAVKELEYSGKAEERASSTLKWLSETFDIRCDALISQVKGLLFWHGLM